ncbi:MAG: 6-carboxytetrahydropterin synthase [Saprospiraceae bacterium]|nr:6-carboxytetrahydropterin synthase [Candidatus Brachybacter algidus]
MIDFKDIKKLVTELIVNKMDHHLLLSQDFLNNNKTISAAENLVIFEAEPTAENLIIFIRNLIKRAPS